MAIVAVVVGGILGAIFVVPAVGAALGLTAAGPVAGGAFASAQAAGAVTAGGILATI